jgi:NTE family protein
MWVAAVRISDGRLVVFGREGNCPRPGEAVAASCAIPGWFTPVEIDGTRYVDGGAHSVTNAALVGRAQHLDLVVISAPMGRTGQRAPGAPWRQMARLQLSVEVQALRRMGIPVLALQPTPEVQAVMGRDPMNGSRRDQIVRQSWKSMVARLSLPDVQSAVEILRAAG